MFAQTLPDGRRFFAALGLGFAAALLAPVALVLVGLTIVGLPAAILGLALFLASLYVAGIRVAALIGTALLPPADASLRAFGLALLAGLAVLAVGTHLPFVGGVVRVVVVLVGLGLLVRHAQEAWRRRPAAHA
jgi:hypothetical protein